VDRYDGLRGKGGQKETNDQGKYKANFPQPMAMPRPGKCDHSL
jgi:hypothetical protein